jgi:predicted RNase H-like nuclease (RuvC/YqgF family)
MGRDGVRAHRHRTALLAEVERLRAEIERLTRERDEARAEVERMLELLRGISINMVDLIERLTRERDEAQAEVERLRADNERLRTVYVLLVSEEAGPVDSATCWYEDKIIGCYISREAAEGAAKLLMADWRINEYSLEGKP